MPGNELDVIKYLVLNKPTLKHIGKITKISHPIGDKVITINSVKDVNEFVKPDSASKKADIYINNFGISIKQAGGSFAFNRLQRANIVNTFKDIGIHNPENHLIKLDNMVDKFHNTKITNRARPWNECFDENDFKLLLEFLMMKGSPNKGRSRHTADYILEAPKKITKNGQISIFEFNDYFESYKNNLKISIRRCWYGQASNSEHNRATSLMKKEENLKWVYCNVSGEPKMNKTAHKKWRDDIEVYNRKTVYFLMIEHT